MSRVKFLVFLFILTMTVLWPIPVVAQDPNPNTCLPTCYAYNYGPTNHSAPASPDGTDRRPWVIDTPQTGNPASLAKLNALRQKMAAAVTNKHYSGTLLAIACNDAQPPSCTAVLYTFYGSGSETESDQGTVPVPDVGVPLPFSYTLGGIALLGGLLVGVGIVLRRRIGRSK